jgi:F0F1-type ATP synthase membrane subunit c/vacuolar-type H+-ATPase subunit K
MSDLLMLALVTGAFAVAAVYAQFCDAIARRPAAIGETDK